MQSCPRCARENEDDVRFCGRCGLDFHEYNRQQASANGEVHFCTKHPKVETLLSCGRCGRPFCTSCLVIGPAGPRCRECGKQNVSFRPSALLYSFKSLFASFGRMGPWGIYLLVIIILSVIGSFRSCGTATRNLVPSNRVPIESGQKQLPDKSPM